MKVGDLVKDTSPTRPTTVAHGIVLETQVNMWGEETIPSGIRIMWSDGDVSVVYDDEVDVITLSTNKIR